MTKKHLLTTRSLVRGGSKESIFYPINNLFCGDCLILIGTYNLWVNRKRKFLKLSYI